MPEQIKQRAHPLTLTLPLTLRHYTKEQEQEPEPEAEAETADSPLLGHHCGLAKVGLGFSPPTIQKGASDVSVATLARVFHVEIFGSRRQQQMGRLLLLLVRCLYRCLHTAKIHRKQRCLY